MFKKLLNLKLRIELMILMICIFFVYNISNANEIFKRDHVILSGPAVHIGLGTLYSQFGFVLEYQFRIFEKLTLDPFISLGYYPGKYDSKGGIGGGGNIEFGKKHRILLGSCYGIQGESYTEHYEKVHLSGEQVKDTFWVEEIKLHEGSSVYLGYRGMSFLGMTWVVTFGLSYSKYDRIKNLLDPTSPSFSIGIGYKL